MMDHTCSHISEALLSDFSAVVKSWEKGIQLTNKLCDFCFKWRDKDSFGDLSAYRTFRDRAKCLSDDGVYSNRSRLRGGHEIVTDEATEGSNQCLSPPPELNDPVTPPVEEPEPDNQHDSFSVDYNVLAQGDECTFVPKVNEEKAGEVK